MSQQHEFEIVADKPGDNRRPSSLDRQLTKYAQDGRRVLNFWRGRGRRWVFKLMVDG